MELYTKSDYYCEGCKLRKDGILWRCSQCDYNFCGGCKRTLAKFTAEEFAEMAVDLARVRLQPEMAVMAACYVKAGDHYFKPFQSMLSCISCKCDSGLVCAEPDWRAAARRWGALLVGVQALAIALSAVLWEWDRLFLGGFPLFVRLSEHRNEDNDSVRHTVPWDIPGRVNSADATITVSALVVLLFFVVPRVVFHLSLIHI